MRRKLLSLGSPAGRSASTMRRWRSLDIEASNMCRVAMIEWRRHEEESSSRAPRRAPRRRRTHPPPVRQAEPMNPDDVEPRFRQAGRLGALGRFEEARADYLAELARAPSHLGALNDLGTLLHAGGFRGAARTCYAEAVAHHPDAPLPRVNLANMLLDDGDLDAARAHYETALARAPLHAEAHQGLARILAALGEDEAAARHRQLGF